MRTRLGERVGAAVRRGLRAGNVTVMLTRAAAAATRRSVIFKKSSATRVKDFLDERSQPAPSSWKAKRTSPIPQPFPRSSTAPISAPQPTSTSSTPSAAEVASTPSPTARTVPLQPQPPPPPAPPPPLLEPQTSARAASISEALNRIFVAAKERLAGHAFVDGTPSSASSSLDVDKVREEEERRQAEEAAVAALNKTERLESQTRIISQAIRRARERGHIKQDESSIFSLFSMGSTPPSDLDERDTIWLSLGPDPENWAKRVPPINDRWLETLSLRLNKSIVVDQEDEGAYEDDFLDSLVDDYDLEDHERLEQLGDSIVNMSSRLLAYQTYPDINERTLTMLSNYPAQNNILGILYRESGLPERRRELREELKRLASPSTRTASRVDDGLVGEGTPTAQQQPPFNGSWRLTTEEKLSADTVAAVTDEDGSSSIKKGLVKKDADVFEAYVAAVFLSHNCDFNVVHAWLSELFRPFLDQAMRFMIQGSEIAAQLNKEKLAREAATRGEKVRGQSSASSAIGLKGVYSSSLNPTLTGFGTFSSPIPAPRWKGVVGLGSIGRGVPPEGFVTDEFLTVAARARRLREEALLEEARLRDQQELMAMGWFQRGFLNLRQGFSRHVLDKQEDQQRRGDAVAQARSVYGRGPTGRLALQIAATQEEREEAAKRRREEKKRKAQAAAAAQR